MAKFKISLDIQRHETQIVLSCKQTDIGSSITIALHENGVPYPLTSDNYAVFAAKKEDGTEIVNDCTIDLVNNRIVYEITPQTIASLGIVRCELQVFGFDREQIASPTFNILVREAVLGEVDIESSSEYGALNYIINDVRKRLEYGDFDGADGITPLVRINSNTKVWEASYDNGLTYESLGIYSIGENGTDGDDGVGILTISKTETNGLVDTYTVLLTDNRTYTFTVTNGERGYGVPVVTSSDEGKVLTAEGGAWVAKDLPINSVKINAPRIWLEGSVVYASTDSASDREEFYLDGEIIAEGVGTLDLSAKEIADGIHTVTARSIPVSGNYTISEFGNTIVYVKGELTKEIPSAEGVSF